MENGAHPSEQYYILTTSAPVTTRTLVLKQDETFGVFDDFGDIDRETRAEDGIYHEGTRFLSRLALRLPGGRPLLLSSSVRRDNIVLGVDLTNPDIYLKGELYLPRGALHIYRAKFLSSGVLYERIRVRNYGAAPVSLMLALQFEADYVDIFEVRGTERERRGQRQETEIQAAGVVLVYAGLDGVTRRTRLHCTPKPAYVRAHEMFLPVQLAPKAEETFLVTVAFETSERAPRPDSYELGLTQVAGLRASNGLPEAGITSSNEQFNVWVERSRADLNMMISSTEHGPYPYAGVPWFSTPFGRDGIITAFECLWVAPSMARGVLGYLAATQAASLVAECDSEPGKILHEARKGEMCALGEVPFREYYGSIDSTPLFLMLAAAYFHRTGDREFLGSIWSNIAKALEWIDRYGDRDGDGFVEYARQRETGLINQGWKDSTDSVFHADGELARAPVALCEVQAYVYAAKTGAARVAAALGKRQEAEELARQAAELKARFERVFWCEEIGAYALALDGEKRPCRVRSSNSGHCLFAGIASPEHAARAAGTLMEDASFSGWGVRTIAETEAAYNPMSYHNGSVWPHDVAMVAYGFCRYGFRQHALKLLEGLFEASLYVDLHRLPELFCGFPRRPGRGPTLYPVACAPQAWASGSAFLLLQAALGLTIDAGKKQILLSYPALPESLDWVRLRNLRVGDASADIVLRRYPKVVAVDVENRSGDVEIVVVK